MNGTTISISKLRQNTSKVINSVVKRGEPLTILSRSEPKAVIADFDYFNALEEAVLDLTDTKEAEKAKKEPRTTLSSYIKKRWGNEAP
ncbi:type II toxin-antitoxin system Phd/YefM family antitoxin [Patescibacteria group bacterium]|nr:type II toxin-antitoxin system Phd/YefM family antitoxin [Patescibacteria group bacterium]